MLVPIQSKAVLRPSVVAPSDRHPLVVGPSRVDPDVSLPIGISIDVVGRGGTHQLDAASREVVAAVPIERPSLVETREIGR